MLSLVKMWQATKKVNIYKSKQAICLQEEEDAT